jgi:hypothetical protein
MDFENNEDIIVGRVKAITERLNQLQEVDLYFYNQPVTELRGGARQPKMLSTVMALEHMGCECLLEHWICTAS